MLTYKFFLGISKNPEYNYNVKKALKLVIQAKYNKSTRKTESKKAELFYNMHQIVLLHIDSYRSMCSKDYDHSNDLSAFQYDDLISEFYIIFHKCVRDYKIEKRDKNDKRINFYFYYKKSLTWAIQRIYQVYQRKSQKIDLIGSNDWKYDVQTTHAELDFSDWQMEQWGFTQIEKDIVVAKVEGILIKDFIEEKSISSSEYYKKLQCIKDKIKKQIYAGNFIYDQFVDSKGFQYSGIGGTQQRSVLLAGQRLCDATKELL